MASNVAMLMSKLQEVLPLKALRYISAIFIPNLTVISTRHVTGPHVDKRAYLPLSASFAIRISTEYAISTSLGLNYLTYLVK